MSLLLHGERRRQFWQGRRSRSSDDPSVAVVAAEDRTQNVWERLSAVFLELNINEWLKKVTLNPARDYELTFRTHANKYDREYLCRDRQPMPDQVFEQN